MFRKIISTHLALALALLITLISGWCSSAQAQGDTVLSGTTLQISIRGVPQDEAGQINGPYKVASNGTIKLPHIGEVKAAGLTSRSVENALATAYKNAEIFTNPTFVVLLNASDTNPHEQTLTIGGYVRQPRSIRYVQGMTLFQAINEAGGLTDFGSRYCNLTRNGQTRRYDYFNSSDKTIKVQPNDMIEVQQRGAFESRP